MNTEQFFEFVDQLKLSDLKYGYLRKFKPQKYIDCMVAFETCFMDWTPSKDEPSHPDASFKTKFLEAWLNVRVDLRRMALAIGPSLLDIMEQLKRSYSIYPDGTINEKAIEFFDLRIALKEKRR